MLMAMVVNGESMKMLLLSIIQEILLLRVIVMTTKVPLTTTQALLKYTVGTMFLGINSDKIYMVRQTMMNLVGPPQSVVMVILL